jgi:chromosome segregation ATPase
LNLQTLLNDKSSELENIQVDSDGRNNRLKSQLKEKEEEISDLTRQKTNSEKLRSELTKELEEKNIQLGEAEESSRYLSEEMGKLKKRLIESDEELTQLLVIKTSYEELKRTSETLSRQKQGIIDEFEAQIAQLNASRRQAEEKYADLESEFEGMVMREKSAVNGKTALQQKIRELQDEQDDLVNDADSARANCRIAEGKLAEVSGSVDQYKLDIEQYEEDLRRAKNKVKALEDELVNVSEAERRRMEVELRALKQVIAEKEDEVKRASDNLDKEKRDSKRYRLVFFKIT